MDSNRVRVLLALVPALVLGGCLFQEHLPQVDIHGTVRVPVAAATRTITDPRTGELVEVTDARFIGPVYLGAFPSVREGLFDYPHPEIGPVITAGQPGNTYPYGGGTVGRFDFACFESSVCKVVTGRYVDYDDLLTFFRDYVNQPITDEFGATIESSDYYRAYCYELFDYTADFELDFISGEDGLDFKLSDDGQYFEAEFDMWQVEYHPNMQLWGWMDSPNEDFDFATCNEDDGQQNTEYTTDFRYGTNYTDLLNFPSVYIHEGDWVTPMDKVVTLTDADADAFRAANIEPVLELNLMVE